MFPKSIRWRIQAWHGVLLVFLVVALVYGFYNYEQHARFREVDSRLHETISPLLPRLAPFRPGDERGENRGPRGPRPDPLNGPPEDRLPNREERPDNERVPRIESAGLYYIVWDADNELVVASPNAPAEVAAPAFQATRRNPMLRTRGEFRELIHFVPNGRRVLLGTSTAHISRELHQLALLLTVAGAAVLGLGLGVGWWMTARAIRPISKISSAAEKIAKGDLTERIDVSETESELGQLSRVLNETFERLQTSFDQQARFTADASHELRTPIAVMLTQIQLARSKERTGDEYRHTLETCEQAVERMRTLVNQMLQLARMDIGEQTLILDWCDLAEVAREALEFIEPLAQQKKVRLTHALQSVRMKADVMKLGQVLTNLLNNSILHNKEGIEVNVSVEQAEAKAIIRVADTGGGIPQEALPHLFERFYRVDKARSHRKGSSGLGLAICKALVEGHRGTIRVESPAGKGAVFIVELPLNLSKGDRSA